MVSIPSSYWLRRTARHVILVVATLACGALFWKLFAVRSDLISHLSIATAYPALFLVTAALILGPWNALCGRPNPISFDLRRDVGIWAGIVAIVHTMVGLNVHLRGRPWLYFVDQHHKLRDDMFGFANDTGTIAALLFLLVLVISNDVSLRRLGVRKWKSLQRWTYVAAALTVLHAAAYQSIEKRQLAYLTVFWIVVVLALILQLAGWVTVRRTLHPQSERPEW